MHEPTPQAAIPSRQLLEQFESLWQAGTPPSISRFLESLNECVAPDARRALLHEMVAIDLWHRWTRLPASHDSEADELKSRPRLEDYACRYAELGSLAELPAAVIREEYRVRRLQGESVRPRDYCERFAGRKDVLDHLNDVERELSSDNSGADPDEFSRKSGPQNDKRVIRCPNCQSEIATVGNALDTVLRCSSCGGSIRLVGECNDSRAFSVGSWIDHFQLLERLGTGSFGTVWKARDKKLDRDVAIKLPRNGQLKPTEAAIFVREAQSAAQLHHPNIVAVHEVGLVDGVPYIVSDLVRGVSLSEQLKRNRYTPREAAALCAKVADALHHAHEAGVVHRDLKPGNLLLDESGEPQLTDFGLASRVDAEATLTIEGQVLGTPGYMSPEQARGDSHLADRRSDIYSLGVMLYLMLTGELPFRGSAHMMIVQIIQDDPTSPRKLVGGLPRDLETICLKCLEKQPGKRYSTAAALADDLRRFLQGAPISARPISHLERAWKLCRAHPMAASLVVSTIAFLVILASGLALWNVQTTRLLAEVERNETSARASFGLALDVLDETMIDVQERLQFVPGADAAREEILNRGLKSLEQLVEDESRFRPTNRLMAAGHFSLGQMYLRQGDARRAEEQFRRGHEAALSLARSKPNDVQAIRELGVSYGNLADLNVQKGNALVARSDYEQAISELERVGPSAEPALARMLARLGILCLELRDVPKAREYLDRAYGLRKEFLDKSPDDAQLARELWEVTLYCGDAKAAASDLPGALRDYREAVRLAEASLNVESTGRLGPDDVATSYQRLATALLHRYDIDEANALYEKALVLREQLANEDPANAEHQRALAVLYDHLGGMHLGLQDAGRAHEWFERALDVRKKLVASRPHSDQFRIDMLSSYANLARAEEGRFSFDKAIDWNNKGLALWKSLNFGRKLEQQPRLAQLRAELEAQRGRCKLYRRTVDELHSIIAEYPEKKVDLLQNRALLLAKRGQFDRAEAAADELATKPGAEPGALDSAAYAFARLAQALGDALNAEDAAPEMAAKRRHFEDRAMMLLEQAQAAGIYRMPSAAPYLRYSHAFRDLRPRPEFQQLLGEVASQTPRQDGSESDATRMLFQVR